MGSPFFPVLLKLACLLHFPPGHYSLLCSTFLVQKRPKYMNKAERFPRGEEGLGAEAL
jgi:hypothetical protein